MNDGLKKAWADVVQPLISRPRLLQVAALCLKGSGADTRVLMITSRGTGRWIIPKGWPITGKDGAQTALQEAWEEAGVSKGDVTGNPIGAFSYDKELKTGLPVPVQTFVYTIRDVELSDKYPEAHQRRRKWVSPRDAANMVREPELKNILRQL